MLNRDAKIVDKTLKIEEINKVVEMLQSDIAKAKKDKFGTVGVETTVLIAYIVYKVRVNGKMSQGYKYIKSSEFTESDSLRTMIDINLSREDWEALAKVITEEKYTNQQLKAVVFEDALLERFEFGAKVSETPRSLVELALRILDIQPGETVADICSGLGSFIAEGVERQPEAIFTGYEREFLCANVCVMRLDLAGKPATIENINAMDLFKKSHRLNRDKIFSNYPFGQRLRMIPGTGLISELLKGKYEGFKSTTSSDWVYNTLVSELLSEDGKAVCLMSRGSTWNSQDKGMRQYFVENGLIECVISLPKRLFMDTAIATSLIVISHNNSRDVRIVDGTELFVKGRRFNELSEENIKTIIEAMSKDSERSQVVSYETLLANDFTLNMTRYLKEEIEFEESVPFGDVIKEIKRGAPLKASELDQLTTDEPTKVKYLTWSDVQDGVISGPLQCLKDVDPKYERYAVKSGNLLISRHNSPYKVGVAEVEPGVELIANGNMYVVTLDENQVDPYYVLAFFNSQAGRLALKSISVGTVITNISIKDLKGLNIPVLDMKAQAAIAKNYKNKVAEVTALRARLAEAEEQLGECFDAGV